MTNKPSYLGAFVRHPINRFGLMSAACLAIFASIPFGLSGLGIVAVVSLGIEALAALAIPDLPNFRASVDRETRTQAQAQRLERYFADINAQNDAVSLLNYQHMCARVSELYQAVDDGGTTLTRADVEKLEDLTVDFLGLSALNLSLRQRKDHANDDLTIKRIAALKAQMNNDALSTDELRQLQNALTEYTEALNRSRRLAVRRAALEATLSSMPDKMEEVYQLVMASPYSTDMGSKLEDSLSRLRIAEEVAAEFDDTEAVSYRGSTQANAVPSRMQIPNNAARQSARAINT